MRKIILIIALCIASLSYAQQEIKVDIADVIILKTLEVSYERYLTTNSSVGISALFNFEKKNADVRYNENRMFTPYYRHYFNNFLTSLFTTDNSWNMFFEVFLGVNLGEKKINNAYENYTDLAFGAAVGSKYVIDGGFIIDIYLGLGRNLFSSNAPIIVPRVGLNIGWQF